MEGVFLVLVFMETTFMMQYFSSGGTTNALKPTLEVGYYCVFLFSGELPFHFKEFLLQTGKKIILFYLSYGAYKYLQEATPLLPQS